MSGNLWMFSDKLDDEDIEIMKPDDILSVGSEETSQAYIPVRNILYISTGDVIRW